MRIVGSSVGDHTSSLILQDVCPRYEFRLNVTENCNGVGVVGYATRACERTNAHTRTHARKHTHTQTNTHTHTHVTICLEFEFRTWYVIQSDSVSRIARRCSYLSSTISCGNVIYFRSDNIQMYHLVVIYL